MRRYGENNMKTNILEIIKVLRDTGYTSGEIRTGDVPEIVEKLANDYLELSDKHMRMIRTLRNLSRPVLFKEDEEWQLTTDHIKEVLQQYK